MAGFADLVKRAQPALLGGGCTLRATEGRDWEWNSEVLLDDDDSPIDFTAIGGVCNVLADQGDAVPIITLDFTGYVTGKFRLSKSAADTVGLADEEDDGRRCVMDFVLLGSDPDTTVAAWTQNKSVFIIDRGL